MKDYTEEILETTRYVAENSKHVHINGQRISEFCRNISFQRENTDWLKGSPVVIDGLSKEDKLQLMLAFNSLSFSYWGDPSWRVMYNNAVYDRGSWSLIAALVRAKEEGFDIFNSEFQAKVTRKDLGYILRGNVEIPLLNERVQILNQVGTVISENYDGNFRNMIEQSENNATKLLARVIDDFSLFEDAAEYNGKKIYFYKRAQALVQSIDSLIEGHLKNADKLTALMDYKLPVPLRAERILVYSDELAELVDNRKIIQSKSIYENEIRANTGQAVEGMRNELAVQGIFLSRKQITDYLWLISSRYNGAHHRTRTTDY